MRMRINRTKNANTGRPTTLQRKLLLDILHEAKGHLNATELYRRAIEKDKRISLATVYRNLRLFKELGLIDERRLDEAHCYYEIKGAAEHYHMVCMICGRIMEFESPLIGDLVARLRQKDDFEVTKAILYLEGYCQKCKDEEDAAPIKQRIAAKQFGRGRNTT